MASQMSADISDRRQNSLVSEMLEVLSKWRLAGKSRSNTLVEGYTPSQNIFSSALYSLFNKFDVLQLKLQRLGRISSDWSRKHPTSNSAVEMRLMWEDEATIDLSSFSNKSSQTVYRMRCPSTSK